MRDMDWTVKRNRQLYSFVALGIGFFLGIFATFGVSAIVAIEMSVDALIVGMAGSLAVVLVLMLLDTLWRKQKDVGG